MEATLGKDISERDRQGMEAVIRGVSSDTKSDKIRALDRAGYRPADIARFLGIRDQFVSNVRRADRSKRRQPPPSQVALSVGEDGRIVIPLSYREMLGIKDGGTVVLHLENDVLRLTSKAADIRRAQEIVARYVPEDVKLVEELIAERRREARDETRHG